MTSPLDLRRVVTTLLHRPLDHFDGPGHWKPVPYTGPSGHREYERLEGCFERGCHLGIPV